MEIDKSASSMKNDVENASASNTESEREFVRYLERLKESPPPKAAECCIYRVPKSLREINEKAYTPQLISIGPFHRYNERLRAMEELKEIYQGEFLKRNEMSEKKIMDFQRLIREEEESVRLCYSESFDDIDKDSFVKMIALDAVFIIEFLKESCAAGFPKNIDTRMRFGIGEDLMLLENQLPFSILDLIYREFYDHSQDENKTPLLDLATCHFGKYYPLERWPESICTANEVKHFTDLLMKSMLKGELCHAWQENRYPVKLKYNAAMLRKAGVKFQNAGDNCLINVRFEKGVLKIPPLEVDDSFERFVRNLMAWERCSKHTAYICNYFKFMGHLINTAEDVDLLIKEGIILNCLDDDAAVSQLMNNLSQRIEITYYSDICLKLNEYYENPWNQWKATLKSLRGTVTVAGTFYLILTFIETITSLKSSFWD